MIHLKIIIYIIFVTTATAFAQTWVRIVPTFSTGDSLLDMREGIMVTKDIGWFADSYIPIGQGNYINRLFKTTDGGHYWTMQWEGNGGFWDFFAIDTLHCFVSHRNGLLRTTNGGTTWEYKYVDSVYGYGKVYYFFNEREGFLYQKYPRRTTDGGDSWQILDSSFALNFQSDVYFSTRSKGWITGSGNRLATDAGYMMKSIDTGYTWQYTHDTLYPPIPLIAIDFIDSLHGYIIGVRWGACGVSYTTDGGQHWGVSSGYVANNCTDIAFLDSTHGWITSYYGEISSSTDGGRTWNVNELEEPLRLGKISAIRSGGIVYIFGEKNTLLRADTATNVREDPKPFDFNLYQNFPNPFNPVTIIRYSLQEIKHVTLKVFNILGKEVAMLVNMKQPPGNYEAAFDASELPSGIYIYELVTGSETIRKKMMMVK